MFLFEVVKKYSFSIGIPKSSLDGLTTSRISSQSNKLTSSSTTISSTVSGNLLFKFFV